MRKNLIEKGLVVGIIVLFVGASIVSVVGGKINRSNGVGKMNRDPTVQLNLAGNSLSEYPYFEFVCAFNEGSTVEIAIDPGDLPESDQTCGIYIVFAKTKACLPIFIVSRAKSKAAFPVSEEIFLLGIRNRDK